MTYLFLRKPPLEVNFHCLPSGVNPANPNILVGDINGNIPQYFYVLSHIADQYWLPSVRSASSRFHSAIRRHQFASVPSHTSPHSMVRPPNLELALTPLLPTQYAESAQATMYRSSVCPSVRPIRPPHVAAAGLLLCAGQPGYIDRLLHGRRPAAMAPQHGAQQQMREIGPLRCQMMQEAGQRLVWYRLTTKTHRLERKGVNFLKFFQNKLRQSTRFIVYTHVM